MFAEDPVTKAYFGNAYSKAVPVLKHRFAMNPVIRACFGNGFLKAVPILKHQCIQ